MTEGNRGSTYPALKKLGLRPGETIKNTFQLPNHAQNKTSTAESAEIIADYFSSVSQEFSPLDVSILPPNVQFHLINKTSTENVPTLSVYEVYTKIVRAKKPNSSVPGDLPKKIIQHFPAELSVQTSIIFNNIITTLAYPDQWKIEYQIPVPKVHPPKSEDDLRNIAKTPFLSKVFESFIAGWLLPII